MRIACLPCSSRAAPDARVDDSINTAGLWVPVKVVLLVDGLVVASGTPHLPVGCWRRPAEGGTGPAGRAPSTWCRVGSAAGPASPPQAHPAGMHAGDSRAAGSRQEEGETGPHACRPSRPASTCKQHRHQAHEHTAQASQPAAVSLPPHVCVLCKAQRDLPVWLPAPHARLGHNLLHLINSAAAGRQTGRQAGRDRRGAGQHGSSQCRHGTPRLGTVRLSRLPPMLQQTSMRARTHSTPPKCLAAPSRQRGWHRQHRQQLVQQLVQQAAGVLHHAPLTVFSARSHSSIMSDSVSKLVPVSSAAQFLVAALLYSAYGSSSRHTETTGGGGRG